MKGCIATPAGQRESRAVTGPNNTSVSTTINFEASTPLLCYLLRFFAWLLLAMEILQHLSTIHKTAGLQSRKGLDP